METITFSEKLIEWYDIHKRDLPWRNTKDPYKIWLSEVILQQTRVVQGKPYYQKFINNYPRIQDMAYASEEEILRLWQGLGYYSRARNMHFTAKYITHDLNGLFPNNYEEIKKLKGVGAYTAAAISSFAFEEKQAVVDGNVFRVLSRIYGVFDDTLSAIGKKKFNQLAYDLLPEKHIDIHNQAIMEFGALQCLPKKPNCNDCVFNINCYAYKYQKQTSLPVKLKKNKIIKRDLLYFVFLYQKKSLVKVRSEKDIWQGLYDFPVREQGKTNTEFLEKIYSRTEGQGLTAFQCGRKIEVCTQSMKINHITDMQTHVLSHQKIYVRFLILTIFNPATINYLENNLKGRFQDLEAIDKLPKPILIANFLKTPFFDDLKSS